MKLMGLGRDAPPHVEVSDELPSKGVSTISFSFLLLSRVHKFGSKQNCLSLTRAHNSHQWSSLPSLPYVLQPLF